MTLTENRREPDIVNNSDKTIIGHILRFEYENGRGTGQYINLKTCGIRLNVKNLAVGLLPGCTESPRPGDVQTRDANLIPLTIIRIVLDAIVFADGQFVGPDRGHNFERMANQVIAEQALAERVDAARNDPAQREATWAEVARLIQPPSTLPLSQDRQAEFVKQAQESVARDLLFAKNGSGEDAAYDVADRELAIPELWTSQQ
jgi:hypothetical protein